MNIIRSFLAAAVIASAATAAAMPALQRQFVMTQPDGSQVTLTLRGDEFCHFYTTDDGQIVVGGADGYYFAEVGSDGLLVRSAVLASDPAERSAEQVEFLQGLSRQSINQAVEATRQASPLLRKTAADGSRSGENTSAGIGLMPGTNFPTHGQARGVCILVEYQDIKFSKSDEETKTYFQNMLSQPGFDLDGAVGSAWDYFNQSSMGQFDPQFDVLGPVTLPNNRAYYGGNNSAGNDKAAYRMLVDAADILAAQGVDFAPYDNDGDNKVDLVYVLYAGQGEADSGVEDAVWPHQFSLNSANTILYRNGKKVGNVYINEYACGNELDGKMKPTGIGTFCHEFSHALGLPDLYDTRDSYANYTPGGWDVMDQGSYNGESRRPPVYSSFERNAVGWIDPVVIDRAMDIELYNLAENNTAYVVLTSQPNEFFLLENRQQVGFDTDLPYHGMLIWHIAYDASKWKSNIVNTVETKQLVDLVEAYGKTGSTSVRHKSYPFPGSMSVRKYTFKTWDGVDLGLPLTDIKEANGVITAKVAGGGDLVSGLGDAIGEQGVRLTGRTLTADQPMDVYDATGRCVAKSQTSATLRPGIYVVVSGGAASKFAVR